MDLYVEQTSLFYSYSHFNLHQRYEYTASQRKRLFTRPLTLALDQRRDGDPASTASLPQQGQGGGVEDGVEGEVEGSGLGESEDRNILERI